MSEMTDDEKIKGVMGCLWLVLYPLHLWWWGFVAIRVWAWFIAPFGLPTPSLWTAVGLGVTLKFFASRLHPAEPERKRVKDYTVSQYFASLIATAYVYPAFVLLTGWLVRWAER